MLNVSRATPAMSPAAPPRVSRTVKVAERDIACQCCQQQVSKQHNAMLLCDGCDRGYHQVTLFGTTFGQSAQGKLAVPWLQGASGKWC
jgi:hypothetical protein